MSADSKPTQLNSQLTSQQQAVQDRCLELFKEAVLADDVPLGWPRCLAYVASSQPFADMHVREHVWDEALSVMLVRDHDELLLEPLAEDGEGLLEMPVRVTRLVDGVTQDVWQTTWGRDRDSEPLLFTAWCAAMLLLRDRQTDCSTPATDATVELPPAPVTNPLTR